MWQLINDGTVIQRLSLDKLTEISFIAPFPVCQHDLMSQRSPFVPVLVCQGIVSERLESPPY